MKITCKILLLILAACLLAVPLAGCSKEEAPNPGAVGGDNSEVETDEPEPPHVTYNGTPVTIFTWQPFYTDFILKEEDAYVNAVSQALWERNLAVEEKLDVTIDYISIPGHYPEMNNFINSLEASVSVGDAAFDIVQQYSLAAAVATVKGLYLDIAQNDEVNLTGEYWPANIRDNIAYQNKLYFLTGDIAPTVLANAFCIGYNKDMLRNLDLESPYTLYKNNEWTWTKFFEMCKELYDDQGAPGVDDDDRYAMDMSEVNAYDAVYFSAGLRLIEKGADGKLMISEDFRGDTAATLFSKMLDFVKSEDVVFPAKYFGNFSAGNSLFSLITMGSVFENVDHAIAPMPKYAASQDGYYTVSGMNVSIFSIPYDTPSFEVSGAVMEFLAKESYKTVTPALFEDVFKLQISDSPEEAEMFDAVRKSLVYDFGVLYGERLVIYGVFRNGLKAGDSDWGSRSKTAYENASTRLETLVGVLEELKR